MILILAITFITIKLNVGLERTIILDYINRSIHAIGKNYARITAIETESGIKYTSEFGELTDERKALIQKAMADGDSHGYDLRMIEHRYFFVENFYETDFKKMLAGDSIGTRIFDLSYLLETYELPYIEKIAKMLKNKSWS